MQPTCEAGSVNKVCVVVWIYMHAGLCFYGSFSLCFPTSTKVWRRDVFIQGCGQVSTKKDMRILM